MPYIPLPPIATTAPLRPLIALNIPLRLVAALELLGAHPEPSQATLRQQSELSLSPVLASPTQQQHPATKLVRHAAAPSSIAAPNAILPTPVYTPIDTAIAPGHCSRLRLETKGNRGLAPTTARAGFGAHL